MDEKNLYQLQLIQDKADNLYCVWRKHLERFGERPDYWGRVIAQVNEFADRYKGTPYETAAGEEMIAHVRALEIEWRRIRRNT